MQPIVALPLLILCAPSLLAAQRARPDRMEPFVPGRLLVSGFDSNAVHSYRAWDGVPRGSAAANGAQSIVLGPDGLLYVCAEKTDRVVRFERGTL